MLVDNELIRTQLAILRILVLKEIFCRFLCILATQGEEAWMHWASIVARLEDLRRHLSEVARFKRCLSCLCQHLLEMIARKLIGG